MKNDCAYFIVVLNYNSVSQEEGRVRPQSGETGEHGAVPEEHRGPPEPADSSHGAGEPWVTKKSRWF